MRWVAVGETVGEPVGVGVTITGDDVRRGTEGVRRVAVGVGRRAESVESEVVGVTHGVATVVEAGPSVGRNVDVG